MNVDISYNDASSIIPNDPSSYPREPNVFSPEQLGGWLFIADVGAIGAAFFMAHLTFSIMHRNVESQHTVTSLVGSAVILLMMMQSGLYTFSRIQNRAQELKLLATSITSAFLFILAMSFTYAELRFSRTWYIGWYIYTLGFVTTVRFLAWRRLHKLASNGRLRRRIAVFGSGPQAARLIDVLETRGQPWTDVVGLFDDRVGPRDGDRQITIPCGSSFELIRLCRKGKIDELIIALPWSAERRLTDLISMFENLPTRVRLAPDLAAFSFPRIDTCGVYGLSFLSPETDHHSGFWTPVKALEDYLLSAVLIVLLSPLMLAIAMAVKFSSPGPIIYKQVRHGLNNRTFRIFKFRTMFFDEDPASGITIQATKQDPRVTSVGRILRKTSLDELPQLFNVLYGEMSLVGPRPHAPDHNDYHGSRISRYFARHRVKPGMTGWAQVHGLRGEIDVPEKMRKRIEYDLDYIENWSVMLDLVILFRTIIVVLFQKTAY